MSSGEVLSTLKETLVLLEEVGLKAVAIVRDQGSNFCSLLSLLGVSKVKPFFIFNNRNYFVMADFPHLLKSICNCLLKNNNDSSIGTAKWSVIEEMFNLDKTRRIQLCPRLRKKDFQMKAFRAKMKLIVLPKC